MPGKAMMKDHVQTFIRARSVKSKPNTVRNLELTCRRFAAAWDKTRRSPRSLSADWVEDYLVDLGQDVSTATVTVYENSIRSFLKWCAARDLVPAAAVGWTKVGTSTSRRGRKFLRLNQQQLVDLYEGCPNWYFRGVMAALVFTACRGGELQVATVGDVDFEARRVGWVRPKLDDYDDRMPMNEQFIPELKRYLTRYAWEAGRDLRHDDYLFPRYRVYGAHLTERIYPDRQRDYLWLPAKREIARVLDVPVDEVPKGEAAHTIRRSVATHLYTTWRDAGFHDPVGRVQALLGHQSRATTERYIGLSTLREARDEAVLAAPFFATASATVVDIADRRERA